MEFSSIFINVLGDIMISIIEQGFLRRNWGKLALGGGALAFAASRGEEMPIGAVGRALGKAGAASQDSGINLRRMADQVKAAGKTSGRFVKGVMQDPNAALQKGATAAGTVTRKMVDTGQQTGQNFMKGYEGKPNIPNSGPGRYWSRRPEPNVVPKPESSIPNSNSSRYWSRSHTPNVPLSNRPEQTDLARLTDKITPYARKLKKGWEERGTGPNYPSMA
jgi:hypothetical protein